MKVPAQPRRTVTVSANGGVRKRKFAPILPKPSPDAPLRPVRSSQAPPQSSRTSYAPILPKPPANSSLRPARLSQAPSQSSGSSLHPKPPMASSLRPVRLSQAPSQSSGSSLLPKPPTDSSGRPVRSSQVPSQSSGPSQASTTTIGIPGSPRGRIEEVSQAEIDKLKESCPFCKRSLALSDLFAHVKEAHRSYLCVYCLTHFRFPKELMVHLHRLHRIPSQKYATGKEFVQGQGVNSTFLCVECNLFCEPSGVSDFNDFLAHECQKSTGSCPKCGSIIFLSLMGEHVSFCKSNPDAIKKLEDKPTVTPTITPPESPCPSCGQLFPVNILQTHTRSCDSLKPRPKLSNATPNVTGTKPFKNSSLLGDKVSSEKVTEDSTAEPDVTDPLSSLKTEEDNLEPKTNVESESISETIQPPEKIAENRPIPPPQKKAKMSAPPARTMTEKRARQLVGKEVSISLEPQPTTELKDRRNRDNTCRRCGDKVTASTLATHMRSCSGHSSYTKILPSAEERRALLRSLPIRRGSESLDGMVLMNSRIPDSPNQIPVNKISQTPPQRPPPTPEPKVKLPPLDPLLTESDPSARLLMLINGLADKLEKERTEGKRPSDIEKFTLIFTHLFSEMSDARILNRMIQKSSVNCNYCRQVTLIRIDKRQLVIHLLYHHDWDIWSGKSPEPAPITEINSESKLLEDKRDIDMDMDLSVHVKQEKNDETLIEGEKESSLQGIFGDVTDLNSSGEAEIMEASPVKTENSQKSNPVGVLLQGSRLSTTESAENGTEKETSASATETEEIRTEKETSTSATDSSESGTEKKTSTSATESAKSGTENKTSTSATESAKSGTEEKTSTSATESAKSGTEKKSSTSATDSSESGTEKDTSTSATESSKSGTEKERSAIDTNEGGAQKQKETPAFESPGDGGKGSPAPECVEDSTEKEVSTFESTLKAGSESICTNGTLKTEVVNTNMDCLTMIEPEAFKIEMMEPPVVDEPTPVQWEDFKQTILRKVFQSDNLIFHYERQLKQEFGEIPCECLLCGFMADSQKNLFPHWRKIHPGVAYKCVMCQGPFLYAGSLFSHLCTGTPEPFLNAPSTLSTDGSGNMTYTDTVFLKYQCGICDDLKLPGFFNYMVHLRKDHNKCELCLQTLSDQKQLERHMKKHQLNYFCWKCDKDYCIVLNYEQHLLWKHGTESETCSKCLKKRWAHIYHFCIPPDSFKCDVCGLFFTRAKCLRVHSRLHTGENLKKCSACTTKFVSNKLVQKHFEETHITKAICDTPTVGDDSVKSEENLESEHSQEETNLEDKIKEEDSCKEQSESMDVTDDKENPEEKVPSPVPEEQSEGKIDVDSKEGVEIIEDVKDKLPDQELIEAEDDSADELDTNDQMSESNSSAHPTEEAPVEKSPERKEEEMAVLNGDILDELMDENPVNSPDDSKKPFILAEVQGPNLSEDESGSDSEEDSKSEKEIKTPLLLSPPLSNSSAHPADDRSTTDSPTMTKEDSGSKEVPNMDDVQILSPAVSNKDDSALVDVPDTATSNSPKNENNLSLNLEAVGSEGEQKQPDDFGSMSPLLPPLDDFNFNVPEIPTFEDDSLPDHIIRENALFSLRLEHDYAVPTAARTGGGNMSVKRKTPGDTTDENRLPVKNSKKVKTKKQPVVKEPKGKKKRRHSSTSSSSSSSSSSSCGSNCSCSSKSSGSSSSSSDNSSDSSGSDSDDSSSDHKRRSPEKKRHHKSSPKKKNKVKKQKIEKIKLVKPVKIKKVKEPKLKIKKTLLKPKQSKKCTKSGGRANNVTTTEAAALDVMNDILRHFKNPEDAYILETDLDTDDSGSDEVFHQKQLTEVIGKPPAFMDEVWTLGNELFLLRMVRGVSSLEELRPKPIVRQKQSDVYSLKRSENAPVSRLKVRNVPIKPIIVRRVAEVNGSTISPINNNNSKGKKTGNSLSSLKGQGQLQTSLNLTPTSNTIMISRGAPIVTPNVTPIPNPALASTLTTPRSSPKIKITPRRKPIQNNELFPVSKSAAAASVSFIAGTEMTLECVNRLTDDVMSSGRERSKSSTPVVRKAKMKISTPKNRKSEQHNQQQLVQQQHQQIDETLYCICQCPHDNVSQMIGCDARDCPYQWFHFECVGILIAPKGKWYCPECREKRRKKAQTMRGLKVESGEGSAGHSRAATPNQLEGGNAPNKFQTSNSNLLVGHNTSL